MWYERFPEATAADAAAAMTELGDYLEALPKEQFPNLTAIARLMVGQPQDAGADQFYESSGNTTQRRGDCEPQECE